MDFCKYYDFEYEEIHRYLANKNIGRVLLQFPEGLQPCIDNVVDELKRRFPDIEFYISTNPSYGSCLVDEYSAREIGAQLIIHFGHYEYPGYRPSIDVLYIGVKRLNIDIQTIGRILDDICGEKNISKLCLATTAQHIKDIYMVIDRVERCKIFIKGTIYGCIPLNPDNCDAIVIISGGKFHCISQSLALLSMNPKPRIFCIDPYIQSVIDPEPEVEKILRTRMWKMFQASNAKKWLIVTGFYGQYRENIVKKLVEKLKSLGKEYRVVKSLRFDREILANIDAEHNYDAIVVTSCPYIAFDLKDYGKPVLTVGEAFMVLENNFSSYRYPW
ncbi:diphthamide biosynthesis protein [Ignisphaera aggregans DSM 17230]|uniref:2-(3-amino-3-carboxypropyl)histidine synthase n=1 Tax=Ignisphaera aggregans (strain DSM 17230 / JCM 13409 / AQ1.S1) TaxID=583356 RepID=E0SNR6_IGNAA|nr:diphthamide biosynthesis protein [Ignisphaera aggregans DSM 17230]